MRKITFIWTECLIFAIFIVWFVFTLGFFKVINIDMSWIAPNLGDKSDAMSNIQISVIPGATVIQNIGSFILVLGVMIGIVYAALSVVFYFNDGNKNALFWCNIGFYGLTVLSLLVGILFLVVNF
ncbi:MAG: hypothetical protein HDR31_01260 [Mycoplasma sp.]|nr:hypothetical protein [Mycoplasma sp.]